jgi:hypothetical protein
LSWSRCCRHTSIFADYVARRGTRTAITIATSPAMVTAFDD